MSKFARNTTPRPRAPIVTTETRRYTHEGGVGWERDARSELFLLGVTNLVNEDTFYESAAVRDGRFRELVRTVTALDPEWVRGFTAYLRDTAQLRSAPIVVAAEYVAAGGPDGRALVNAACQRADEPAEFLSYWMQNYGRSVPWPVKRGLGDAVRRLYTQRSALRYDGKDSPMRFGDVIEIIHPTPTDEAQGVLFKHLMSVRKGTDWRYGRELLPMLVADERLRLTPEGDRRVALASRDFQTAEWSWERLSGWLPGGMDAGAWEAVIPKMGYMALLRNLRNFDRAGISEATCDLVARRLADPTEVAKSRQLPLRFLSAWREVQSLRWGYPLEMALEHSVANVPALPGRTLILVDASPSMDNRISTRSERRRWEVAATFGGALAKKAQAADVYSYSHDAEAWETRRPLLVAVDELHQRVQRGNSTYTWRALAQTFNAHDRVIILTDEQAHDQPDSYPETAKVPLLYTFNLAGYAPAHAGTRPGWYAFGGLTDATFRLFSMLEATQVADWNRLFAASSVVDSRRSM